MEFAVGGGYRVLLTVDSPTDSYTPQIVVPDSSDAAELGWAANVSELPPM
ncbi:hypothetical protein ACQPXH_12880 [Nocardia sp. CA-135953]